MQVLGEKTTEPVRCWIEDTSASEDGAQVSLSKCPAASLHQPVHFSAEVNLGPFNKGDAYEP